jgi:hypothetical protein
MARLQSATGTGQPPRRRNFKQLALQGQRKEKNCGKGQERQETSHDETGSIVSSTIQHFASAFVLGDTEETLAKFPSVE